jgi:Phage XkdN-like tail assembly chaperone protein, TAC
MAETPVEEHVHDGAPDPDDVVIEHPGKEAVRRASEGRTLEPDAVDDATAWFLSDEEEEDTELVQLNIGSAEEPRWINWTIRSVDAEVLRRIQRSGQNRAQRRRGGAMAVPDVDPQEANVRIVVEGTVKPNLAEIARKKGVPESADPSSASILVLKHRFRRKPGLIDQLAGRIMDLSGYDEEDVREAEAAKN